MYSTFYASMQTAIMAGGIVLFQLTSVHTEVSLIFERAKREFIHNFSSNIHSVSVMTLLDFGC